jgi:hypothetical protein
MSRGRFVHFLTGSRPCTSRWPVHRRLRGEYEICRRIGTSNSAFPVQYSNASAISYFSRHSVMKSDHESGGQIPRILRPWREWSASCFICFLSRNRLCFRALLKWRCRWRLILQTLHQQRCGMTCDDHEYVWIAEVMEGRWEVCFKAPEGTERNQDEFMSEQKPFLVRFQPGTLEYVVSLLCGEDYGIKRKKFQLPDLWSSPVRPRSTSSPNDFASTTLVLQAHKT